MMFIKALTNVPLKLLHYILRWIKVAPWSTSCPVSLP